MEILLRVGGQASTGGSNSSRSRLWKLELQRLADQTGMIIEVCHYPPGTAGHNGRVFRPFDRRTQAGETGSVNYSICRVPNEVVPCFATDRWRPSPATTAAS
jgi:hypothetical protein